MEQAEIYKNEAMSLSRKLNTLRYDIEFDIESKIKEYGERQGDYFVYYFRSKPTINNCGMPETDLAGLRAKKIETEHGHYYDIELITDCLGDRHELYYRELGSHTHININRVAQLYEFLSWDVLADHKKRDVLGPMLGCVLGRSISVNNDNSCIIVHTDFTYFTKVEFVLDDAKTIIMMNLDEAYEFLTNGILIVNNDGVGTIFRLK